MHPEAEASIPSKFHLLVSAFAGAVNDNFFASGRHPAQRIILPEDGFDLVE